MPKRKRSGTFRRRKPYKRRRFIRRIPRGLTRKSMLQSHKYVSRFTVNPDVTGAITADSYRVNGMFDPTVAVGGHQPMGFDQMGVFYNKFTVVGCKITCTFSSTASGNTGDSYVVMQLSSNSAVTADFDDCVEQPHTRYGYLTTNAGTGSKRMTMKWSRKKWFGKDKDDNQEGSSSADPTDQVYVHLGAAALAFGADPATVCGVVQLDYIALWHDPKVIAGS